MATEDLEIRESNQQYIAASSRLCANFPGAEVVELRGLIAAWCNTLIPFCNVIFLSHPVTNHADLETRAAALARYIQPKERPPLFCACRDWIPEPLRGAADALFVEAGLRASVTITGMAAQELPALRSVVPNLEFRRAADAETRNQFADINAAAYGMPNEIIREALAIPQIWSDDFAGHVALLEGRAVAAAATMAVGGSLHVMCVATIPECQRRGYAEATMRHSLQEMSRATGLSRTTLHASEAGLPAYRRMGYRETATFAGYSRREIPA